MERVQHQNQGILIPCPGRLADPGCRGPSRLGNGPGIDYSGIGLKVSPRPKVRGAHGRTPPTTSQLPCKTPQDHTQQLPPCNAASPKQRLWLYHTGSDDLRSGLDSPIKQPRNPIIGRVTTTKVMITTSRPHLLLAFEVSSLHLINPKCRRPGLLSGKSICPAFCCRMIQSPSASASSEDRLVAEAEMPGVCSYYTRNDGGTR
ncbi:hypothetical protein B0H66DRAFT_182242 [Apodospora peruviana]|uniref:Uncharacterized protein n=1 Tax=Apodospora peruviana TaxID=516989 RepID=A0AAE0IB92_9PEZI|nr:hypothetical protein B0H66DRAFT_182242 [Apodospora peruviana]